MREIKEISEFINDEVDGVLEYAENKAIEYPSWMRDKWDHQHKKVIDKMAKAKTYLDMFK